MGSTFEFVVVGGGPSGSAVASGLANSKAKPKVLLLEAGDDNADRDLRVDGKRWLTFMNPNLNWGYKTSPQEHCNNRVIDYSRGKGLGGSSAINFGVFTRGARDDYDEWARVVGDDHFGWDAMISRFKRLENFHGDLPPGMNRKYAAPNPDDHGTSGPLHVGYAAEWERDLPAMLDLFEEADFPLNPDHNSGNPIGMSVLINSSHKGLRSTAKDLITPTPHNLTVITSSQVQKVILDGSKAVGVEAGGKQYFASKEVVLCAGALDDPRILMHSGIGPRDQLEKFEIPIVKDVPSVGQGLRDHMFCPLVFKRKEGDTDRAAFYGDKELMEQALEQWKRDGTGPWAKFACEMGIGFFKLNNLDTTPEFKVLPTETQRYLRKDTVPHYEMLTHFPIHWFVPGFPQENLNCSCLLVFYYNSQSYGEVTLQSSDPSEPMRFDPRFLASPFDRRVAIDSLRDAFRISQHEGYVKNNTSTIVGPVGESDEQLLHYWKENISSSWHMTGTVKMGKEGDDDAAVDKEFRVKGFEKLRVADMSVVPVLPNCHIQAVAYVTGMACADKLIVTHELL